MPNPVTYISKIRIGSDLYTIKDLEARAKFYDNNILTVDANTGGDILNVYTKAQSDLTFQPIGNYLTQHQSLADYLTSTQVNTAINDAKDILIQRIQAIENVLGDSTGMQDVLATIQSIKNELINPDNPSGLSSFLDNLKLLTSQLGNKTEAVYYTQEEADAYNIEHGLEDGDEGYLTTNDIKTPAVPNTVKDYVDAEVQACNNQILTYIQSQIGLDFPANTTIKQYIDLKVQECKDYTDSQINNAKETDSVKVYSFDVITDENDETINVLDISYSNKSLVVFNSPPTVPEEEEENP